VEQLVDEPPTPEAVPEEVNVEAPAAEAPAAEAPAEGEEAKPEAPAA